MRDEVTEIKEFIVKLQQKREALMADLRKVEAGIQAMEVLASGHNTVEKPHTFVTLRPYTQYAHMSSQDAVREFLRRHGKPVTVKEIEAELRAGGFTTSSNNWYSIVYTALARLKDKTDSGVQKTGDRWAFREPHQ